MDEKRSLQEVEKVLSNYSSFTIEVDEFDRCIDHIIQLLSDATLMFKNDSYSTATFLSITAIEEIAKVHMGLFTKKDPAGNLKRKKDKLYNHKTKHIIGSNFTISMGTRLQSAIGPSEIEKIIDIAYSGKMIDFREGALYCDRVNGKLQFPSDLIDSKTSKSFLLFAMESFDDNLVGWDNYSIEKSYLVDKMFCDIAGINYKEPDKNESLPTEPSPKVNPIVKTNIF